MPQKRISICTLATLRRRAASGAELARSLSSRQGRRSVLPLGDGREEEAELVDDAGGEERAR